MEKIQNRLTPSFPDGFDPKEMTLPQSLGQGRNRWKCGWAPADCQRWKFGQSISEQINETKWTPPHPHDHAHHDYPPAHDYGHLHVQPLLLAGEVVAAAPPMLPLTHLIIIIIVIIRMIMTIKFENHDDHENKDNHNSNDKNDLVLASKRFPCKIWIGLDL